jgi:hypothetical protein
VERQVAHKKKLSRTGTTLAQRRRQAKVYAKSERKKEKKFQERDENYLKIVGRNLRS